MARSNLLSGAFISENAYEFIEIDKEFRQKNGICSHLNEYVKIHEYMYNWSFFDL